MSHRPLPVPNAHTQPFWRAAAEGVLSLPRCRQCAALHYPPPPRCPRCLTDDFAWIAMSGRATVRGFTHGHLATIPGVAPPFTIVEGELAEQENLVLVALADAALAASIFIGDPVQIVFVASGDAMLPEYRHAATTVPP